MANDPSFASTINNGFKLLGSAETDLQAPAQTQTILIAGASGTKIEEISIQATKSASLVATTVAGLVYLFLYDGTTYGMFDVVTVRAITASATTAPYRSLASDFASGTNRPPNLIIKTGWSLRASQSVAGNASLLGCSAFGADL